MSLTKDFNSEETLTLDKNAQTYWCNSFPTLSPDNVYEMLTEGLPKNTCVSIHFYNYDELTRVICSNETQGVDFKFIFSKNSENTALLENGDVTYSTKDNHGIAKKFQRNFIRLLEEMGIDEIETNSSKVGLYVWPKCGFEPTQSEWGNMQKMLNRRIDVYEDIMHEQGITSYDGKINELRQAANSTNPKSLWDIIDDKDQFPISRETTWGKALTIDVSYLPSSIKSAIRCKDTELAFDTPVYEEHMSLKDPAAVKRAREYLGVKQASTSIIQTLKSSPRI